MVEVRGVEPRSTITSMLGHPQVCLAYYQKLEKIDGNLTNAYRPVALHLLQAGYPFLMLFFSVASPTQSTLGNKVVDNPVTHLSGESTVGYLHL